MPSRAMLAVCVPSLTVSVPDELLPEYKMVAFAPAVMSTTSIMFPVVSCPVIVPLKVDELSIMRVPVSPAKDIVPEYGETSSSVSPAGITVVTLDVVGCAAVDADVNVRSVVSPSPTPNDCTWRKFETVWGMPSSEDVGALTPRVCSRLLTTKSSPLLATAPTQSRAVRASASPLRPNKNASVAKSAQMSFDNDDLLANGLRMVPTTDFSDTHAQSCASLGSRLQGRFEVSKC